MLNLTAGAPLQSIFNHLKQSKSTAQTLAVATRRRAHRVRGVMCLLKAQPLSDLEISQERFCPIVASSGFFILFSSCMYSHDLESYILGTSAKFLLKLKRFSTHLRRNLSAADLRPLASFY